jgi:hypothetical protein
MNFDKIQYISFQSAEEAILVAEFLKGLGFKMDKRCFNEEYYVYEHHMIWQFDIDTNLKFNGFAKIDNKWKAIYNGGALFTYKAEGKKLIRREKLKRLNLINNEESSSD